MRTPYLLLFALIGGLSATCATADEPDDRLRRCADVESDAQRLACYDNASRQKSAQPSGEQEAVAEPAASVPAAAEAPATSMAPRPAAEDRFGVGAPPEPESPAEEPDELGGNITAIEVRRNGERIFTLDNGQVWAEKSPSPSLHLKVGDRIAIKSGLFGSHRLFGSGNRSSGVYRVR
jgi:hypothetical protein